MTDEMADAILLYLETHGEPRWLVERLCEEMGYAVIPAATAKMIDSISRRLACGAIVTNRELEDCLYAIAACSPDDRQWRVYA